MTKLSLYGKPPMFVSREESNLFCKLCFYGFKQSPLTRLGKFSHIIQNLWVETH